MVLSADVIAMTFPSERHSSLIVDGVLSDSQSTAAQLREAKGRPSVTVLTLRSVTIDDTVAHAAEELFADPNRIWNKLEMMHCTGRNPQIIGSGIHKTKQFCFTGSIPTAHNPRYSLDEACMTAIGRALKNCKSLTSLSLKGSRLDRGSLEAFCHGLERSTSLETLQLSHCSMEIPDVVVLSSALKKNKNLTALTLVHCKIGEAPLSEESGDELCRMLESIVSHPSLQVLNLVGMYCTDRAVHALSNLLREPESTLWHLGLKNNIRHPQDRMTVTTLFDALRVNTALTKLQVSGDNVNNEDMERLAQILTDSNQTLRSLNLAANDIGDDGVMSFARRLPGMKGLRTLDLQRNPFTDSSKEAMIAALKENSELERMDLDGKFDQTKAYYLGLNKGGRRLLQGDNKIPLGLWPVVLERGCRMPFNRSQPDTHLDILYNLVHGPALFQSPRTNKRLGDSDVVENHATKRSRKS
jgi:hypothetical protein